MKTRNLDLLLLQYNQSQKELVANEWFATVDALFFRYALDIVDSLPYDADEGVYIISYNASGDLLEHVGHIAFYLNGWRYLPPKNGFIFFVDSCSSYFVFKDGSWSRLEYGAKKVRHKGGNFEVNLSMFSSFEIYTNSDIRIVIPENVTCSEAVGRKLFFNQEIKICWSNNVIFADGVKMLPVQKGGVSFQGYYSNMHKKFIIEKAVVYSVI